jgi:hypothetical protein
MLISAGFTVDPGVAAGLYPLATLRTPEPWEFVRIPGFCFDCDTTVALVEVMLSHLSHLGRMCE